MNEFAEETLKLLFISFTSINTLFKTHVRFSLRVKIKREILIYVWNLKMNRKAYKLCRIISVLLSSFIICMYSTYVGIGILVALEMLQYWIVPTNRRKCWQASIIVYFQCNVLSDTFCSDKWTNKNEMATMIINFMYMCIKINNTDLVSLQE